MIITRPKDMADVLAALAPHFSLGVVGCGLCATTCQTGGKDQVAAMARLLGEHGKKVLWTRVIDGVCQKMLTLRTLSDLEKPEAVLVMACGSGVQTLAGLELYPAYPALDTLYLGSTLRVGRFEEKCSLCGVCLVGSFEGVCPVTLCPKGLLNGPCGGMEDGKCEVDPEKDCAWHRIWTLKEAAGREGDLDAIVGPRPRRRTPRP